jgi:hypothetical protein
VLDERRQLRILYRDSLARMIDLEVLSTRGEVRDLFVRFTAVLSALSFVAALLIVRATASQVTLSRNSIFSPRVMRSF